MLPYALLVVPLSVALPLLQPTDSTGGWSIGRHLIQCNEPRTIDLIPSRNLKLFYEYLINVLMETLQM